VLRHGSDEQVRHLCPFETQHLTQCDVLIVLRQPINSRFAGRIDPRKLAMAQAARRERTALSVQLGADGKQRYVLTEIPSHSAAQDAGMSLTDYADWVYRAGFLYLADPLAAWQTLHDQHERAIEYLSGKHVLRFQTPPGDGRQGTQRHDGTDLLVDVSGGTWLNHAGWRNFPDGELDCGPRSVDGVVNYTFPTTHQGKTVEGIRLKFRAGKVVEAGAARNENFLLAMLDADDGARTAGEVGIGTNYHLCDFTDNTFFDEKIGGTFHIAAGAGYPDSGNTNQSGLHWDMVCDLRPNGAFPGSPGGTITADGEVFQQDGRFVRGGWPGS
jgi:aminopeptidase